MSARAKFRASAILLALALASLIARAHDAHGHSHAPLEARRLKSPLLASEENVQAGKVIYDQNCVVCHGADGKARTPIAGKLAVRPTNLTEYMMESMRDGEIYWIVTNGISNGSDTNMPAFAEPLPEAGRWQLVQYVRELRGRQRVFEKAQLGPYEWKLPPGFPFPKVPRDNPMTVEKVALGRYLFYDKRLSLNQTQSCATCHRQELAFSDGRPRGIGSTGEKHPRGPMSLANVAYSPALTWANPNMRTLENQALVPMFGDQPVELGMTGKEDLLVQRLQAVPRYQKLFAAAFPEAAQPFNIGNITKAIASFERTLLSGESPYDRYRRGDDPNAISEGAKRGESLFFSERLECFHCHGGFNFTGTVDYLDKGFAEVEFHNTGLYNLQGRFSYPQPNAGLYDFTQQDEDVGKFKAPTLRNIAVTAPYMHDGSIRTLEDVVEHYRAGGRKIEGGPLAGNGFDNPNKSEFVKSFTLTSSEKSDVLEFLRSLTDDGFLKDPDFSNPWLPAARQPVKIVGYPLHGKVVQVYAEDGAISLFHDEVPGFLAAMQGPYPMEFVVSNRDQLKGLRPGQAVSAMVHRQGNDYVLDNLKVVPGGGKK